MQAKKGVVILSAMGMMVFLLSTFSLAAGVEIEHYAWGRPKEIEAFKAQIVQYEQENPDIKITLNTLGWGQYWDVLETRMGAGDTPDIYRCVPSFTLRYIKAGLAADLSPYLPEGYWERFSEEGRFFSSYPTPPAEDAKPYAFPQMTESMFHVYNKEYFAMAGIETPKSIEDPWSYFDFELVGRRLKELTPAEYGFTGRMVNTNPWLIYSLGGGFVEMDGKTVNLNKAMVIEGLKWQKRMYDEQIEPISTLFKMPDSPLPLFAQGRLGLITILSWEVPMIDELVGDDFEWDATYLVKGPANFGLGVGGCTIIASSEGKHVKESVDFLIWMNSDEQQEKFCQASTFIPTSVTLKQTMKYDRYTDILKIPLEQLLLVPRIVWINYKLENYQAMRQAHKELIAEAMYGRISVEEALEELGKVVEKNL